jgi:hypothetical protein
MKITNWSRAVDPTSKKSVVLWFDDGAKNCDFRFDVPEADEYEFPVPLRDVEALAAAMGRKMSSFTPKCRLIDWMAFELCRRYCNGQAIPSDGECGIDRYFREHPEAA